MTDTQRSLRRALIALLLLIGGCRVVSPPEPTPSPVATSTTASASSIHFTDLVPQCGIDYSYPELPPPISIRATFGCGCAFLDYDGDGLMDILLVARPSPRLYRNLGHLRFADCTESAGLSAVRGLWHGCAVGDYDGDGRPDLALLGYHTLALLHNAEGRRFVNVTARSGLSSDNGGRWGSGLAFMDLDGDGWLDLILLNYVLFGPNDKDVCMLGPHVLTGCRPQDFHADRGEIWRNLSGSRFQRATDSGTERTHGKALVLAFADIDGDGRPDFYIGNDGTPADLMLNRGAFHFEEKGGLYGVDLNDRGGTISAMGADWGDYDGDGFLDLAVTNFSGDAYPLYRNSGSGYFEHAEEATGIAGPTTAPLGFGVKWADVDNDGWPDLLFANGHVYDGPERLDGYSKLRQPLMLFHNSEGAAFTEIAPTPGGDFARPILGRGMATGDIDNDGRIDALVIDYEGRPLLLHNESASRGHWLTLDLRGRFPNTFAYGARITARSGKRIWAGYVSPASSYLSSSDPRVHFGLGSIDHLDTLTIHWPDGTVQETRKVAVDRTLTLHQTARP